MSLTKTVILHIWHNMSHAPSLLFFFTTEHYLTFHSIHLHSYPTVYSTVNQTFNDVIFTGIFFAPIHRMCLAVLWLKRHRLQFYRFLRVLSAVSKSRELHWAHVGKPTWFSSTDFHVALESTLINQCFRATHVRHCTTWATAHSENFCVRLLSFVCLIFFQCNTFYRSFFIRFSKRDPCAGNRQQLQMAGNSSHTCVIFRCLDAFL